MFNIEYLNNNMTEFEKKENSSFIKIKIGDFEEKVLAFHGYWDRTKYFKQWKEAIGMISENEIKSCLITSMYDPKYANFINIWPMYLENDYVIFQEMVLFFESLKQPFQEKNPYNSIPDRESISSDGSKISEWKINIVELREFYRNAFND